MKQRIENYSADEDQKLDLNSDNLSSESKLIVFMLYRITWLINRGSPKHRQRLNRLHRNIEKLLGSAEIVIQGFLIFTSRILDLVTRTY